jgi:hypothetical protein
MKAMSNKFTAGILIIVIIALAGMYLQYGYQGEPLTEPQVRDIIKEKYPGVADSDIETQYEENCTVCDVSGCRILENCWKANFTDGGMMHSAVIDGSSGGGGIVEETENPCTEWWCDAPECTYFYKEIIPNGSKSYYNAGCGVPEPVCDEGYEKCRECYTPTECVRKTITTMTNPNETTNYYEVIGADAWGSINTTSLYCLVYDEDEMVFYNQTTLELCETIIMLWSKCGNGVCDFEPVYGMIPY